MSLKRIPYIDQAVWDIINPFLTQLHDPGDGGFQVYSESERPNNLTLDDVGKTIWNSTKGCFQEWSGGYWVDLSPKRGAIEDVVKDIISTWNPITLPQWLIDAINNAINTISIETLQSILDSWTPGINAKIRAVIKVIALGVLRDGLTPVKGVVPIPTWLSNYIAQLLSPLATATISLSQIETALQTYFEEFLQPYILAEDKKLKDAIDDLTDKYNVLLLHTHSPTPTSTPTISPIPTSSTSPTPTSSTNPTPLNNVYITLTQRPGTMRVSYVPPYSQGSSTGVRVVEAAFDISITYSGTGTASSLAATYYAPNNGYTTPSGERKVLGYGITTIGSTTSPYTVQNFYLPIASTSTVTPRKTWKYYVIKGNDGSNYFQYDTNINWNIFMSSYYLDHVEIPYGGFDTNAWLTFWDSLDANTKAIFPQY